MNATASITRKNFLLGAGLAGLAAFAAARGGALVAGPTDAGWRLHATIARGGRP